MSKTPFQPVLPAEGVFTDAEFAFVEDSPPIFPENQNSNFGLLRKLWTDKVQGLIAQQDTLYNEKFVDTSSLFLDVWETEVGLPTGRQVTRSEAQRRLDVLARLQKGPFTRPYRQEIVESAITATFGAPVALSPTGIPLSASGVPLYSEAADVKTLYSIRENGPSGKNLMTNGNFESNVTGWGHDGTMTAVARVAGGKVGQYAMRGTAAGVNPYFYNLGAGIPVTPGMPYVISGWVYRQSRAGDVSLTLQWRDAGNSTVIGSGFTNFKNVPQGAWTFVQGVAVAPPGAAYLYGIFQYSSSQVGDFCWLDGVQFEVAPAPLSGVNKFAFGAMETNPAGWGLTNATMVQDTTNFHEGNTASAVGFQAAGSANVTSYAFIGKGKAGKQYTLSAWVYATGAALGKSVRLQFNETGGSAGELGVTAVDRVLTSGWQRMTVTGTIAKDDSTSIIVYFINLSTPSVYTATLDSVQVEEGPVATPYAAPQAATGFVDGSSTPFYYEVRIKSTVTPDMVSLNRELKRITPSGISFDVLSVPDV